MKVLQKLKTDTVKELWKATYHSPNQGVPEDYVALAMFKVLDALTSDGSSGYTKINRQKIVAEGGIIVFMDWLDHENPQIRESCLITCKQCAQELSLRFEMLQSGIIDRLVQLSSSAYSTGERLLALEVMDLLVESASGI